MQALKAAVVIMGILLLAGTAAIALTIIHRLTGINRLAGADHRRPMVPLPGHAAVALPPGARLAGMAGVGDHLVLRLIDPQGRESLMLLDPASGAVGETIELQPSGAAPIQPQDAR